MWLTSRHLEGGDSLCYEVGARMTYINAKMQKNAKYRLIQMLLQSIRVRSLYKGMVGEGAGEI